MHKDLARSGREVNEESLINIPHLWGVLLDSKNLISALTLLGSLLAIFYCLLTTPIYQTQALIQLERNSGANLFNEISSFLPDSESSANAELILLKSRSVLGKTVADLGLDTEIREKYFPLLGKALSRLMGKSESSIDIEKFELPAELFGHRFVLTLLENGVYKLEGPDQALTGKVGVAASHDGITLLVKSTDAAAGTHFTLRKLNRIKAIENIENSFKVKESAKDSGMLQLSYTGEHPDKIRQILHSISENYIQQNIARKSASARNSLNFLEKQIPQIKSQLERAENRLSDFRRTHSSVDLTLEARSVLETGATVNAQLSTLEFEEADLARLYTKSHPMYIALEAKKRDLLKTKATLESQINGMPTTQQDVLRLTRDVESAQTIYMLLLNKQQELNINKASTVGNVRVIDAAEILPDPVHPQLTSIVIASTLGGGLLGICLVLIRNFFKRAIVSSEQIQALGLHVYSSIPFSEKNKHQWLKWKNKKIANKVNGLLVVTHPDELATEAIRSLRTSIYFQLKEAKNNILMVTGPTSQIGKSFVSGNLSAVFAQSGMRVLLVDADMRCGYLHEYFSDVQCIGLAEILAGKASTADCICSTHISGLDMISRGATPLNPSELLLGEHFSNFCNWAGKHYDLVIIDTPPILAVSDAAIVATCASITLMVARFDVTTSAELAASVKRFGQEGHHINGVVLNSTFRRNSQYFQQGYYEYYQYQDTNKK